MGNLMLAAYELGIGSCWIHRAKEDFETQWGRDLLKSLGIEGEYAGIGHCALGYAAEAAPPGGRTEGKPGVLYQINLSSRWLSKQRQPPVFFCEIPNEFSLEHTETQFTGT